MAQHIVLMSAVAPVLAYLLRPRLPESPVRQLAAATAVQIGVLWFWHAPPVFELTTFVPMHVLAQLSLLLAAMWFWSAVFAVGGNARWRPILALLITGKLFCLLGVLLTLAPRPLYAGMAHHGMADLLQDQQLAGLMMIVACPLTYLVAGLICAAKWFASLEDAAAPASNR
jgi:putative membrane protein